MGLADDARARRDLEAQEDDARREKRIAERESARQTVRELAPEFITVARKLRIRRRGNLPFRRFWRIPLPRSQRLIVRPNGDWKLQQANAKSDGGNDMWWWSVDWSAFLYYPSPEEIREAMTTFLATKGRMPR